MEWDHHPVWNEITTHGMGSSHTVWNKITIHYGMGSSHSMELMILLTELYGIRLSNLSSNIIFTSGPNRSFPETSLSSLSLTGSTLAGESGDGSVGVSKGWEGMTLAEDSGSGMIVQRLSSEGVVSLCSSCALVMCVGSHSSEGRAVEVVGEVKAFESAWSCEAELEDVSVGFEVTCGGYWPSSNNL